jgi:hypothetical protein
MAASSPVRAARWTPDSRTLGWRVPQGKAPPDAAKRRCSVGSRSCSRIAFDCRSRRAAPGSLVEAGLAQAGHAIKARRKRDRYRWKALWSGEAEAFDEAAVEADLVIGARQVRETARVDAGHDRGRQKQDRTPASGRTRRGRANEGAPFGRIRDHGSSRSERGWASGRPGSCAISCGSRRLAVKRGFALRSRAEIRAVCWVLVSNVGCRSWVDVPSPLRVARSRKAPERWRAG